MAVEICSGEYVKGVECAITIHPPEEAFYSFLGQAVIIITIP